MPFDTSTPDELLRRFLEVTDEAESASLLEQLLNQHAVPLWERILAHKFYRASSGEDFTAVIEDLQSACKVSLVKALAAAKARPIRDFKGYAAIIAHNAYADYWRRRAPLRASLANKVRYLLKTDRRFTRWKDEDQETWCGWEGGSRESCKITPAQLAEIVKRHEPRYAQIHLRELTAAIFNHAGGALRVDDLTALAAMLWGVKDEPPAPLSPSLPAPQINYWEQETLAFLWEEIKELPSRQRKVLLYHLRDGQNGEEMVSTLFNCGIAKGAELAAAFEVTLAEFYELLPRLPWPDEKIAALLGVIRLQVSNLRRVARDNLRRRLEGKAKRKSQETT